MEQADEQIQMIRHGRDLDRDRGMTPAARCTCPGEKSAAPMLKRISSSQESREGAHSGNHLRNIAHRPRARKEGNTLDLGIESRYIHVL